MRINLVADSRSIPLPDASVHCVVTSPPYWALRDYGIKPSVWDGDETCEHEWGEEIAVHQRGKVGDYSTLEGGDQDAGTRRVMEARQGRFCTRCGAWLGCLGLEPDPTLYVEHLVQIFAEVWRVLHPSGTVWLNLGDTYVGGKGQSGHADPEVQALRHSRGASLNTPHAHVGGRGRTRPTDGKLPGLKPKDLVGIPWLVAFALRRAGWYLRADIIWHKPNGMPESVMDRPTKAHEYVFLLTKSERYYYDAVAVREPYDGALNRWGGLIANSDTPKARTYRDEVLGRVGATSALQPGSPLRPNPDGRNKRSVWSIPTSGFRGEHFATFPPKLVEPCILAGTSERGVCPECGAPWERVVERESMVGSPHGTQPSQFRANLQGPQQSNVASEVRTLGWRPTCEHYDALYRELPRAQSRRKRRRQDMQDAWWPRAKARPGGRDWPAKPAVVLDPFGGSGTTVMVADYHHRVGIGVDISPLYTALAEARQRQADVGAMPTKKETKAGVPPVDLLSLEFWKGRR